MGWAGRDRGAGNVGETFLVNENGHVSLPSCSPISPGHSFPAARRPPSTFLQCRKLLPPRLLPSLSIFLLCPLNDRAIVPKRTKAKVEESRIPCVASESPPCVPLSARPCFLLLGHCTPSPFLLCLWPLQFYVSAPSLPSLPSPLAFTCISLLPLAGSELFLAVDFYLWAAIRKRQRAWWTALRSQPHRLGMGPMGRPPRWTEWNEHSRSVGLALSLRPLSL